MMVILSKLVGEIPLISRRGTARHKLDPIASLLFHDLIFRDFSCTDREQAKSWNKYRGLGSSLEATRNKGPSNIYGVPGPGLRAGGLRVFLTVEKGGLKDFLAVKKGGQKLFWKNKKWGQELFFIERKGGPLFIFPHQRGGQQLFSLIKFWGESLLTYIYNTFSSEKKKKSYISTHSSCLPSLISQYSTRALL